MLTVSLGNEEYQVLFCLHILRAKGLHDFKCRFKFRLRTIRLAYFLFHEPMPTFFSLGLLTCNAEICCHQAQQYNLRFV